MQSMQCTPVTAAAPTGLHATFTDPDITWIICKGHTYIMQSARLGISLWPHGGKQVFADT